MAIKFQYNKTSLQMLEKQLKVRVRTLPIIKNKESALRMEVKRCKEEAAGLEEKLEQEIHAYEAMFALWNEFDSSLVKVKDVHLGIKKIAGVRVPILENVDFETRPFSCLQVRSGTLTVFTCCKYWLRQLLKGNSCWPS